MLFLFDNMNPEEVKRATEIWKKKYEQASFFGKVKMRWEELKEFEFLLWICLPFILYLMIMIIIILGIFF